MGHWDLESQKERMGKGLGVSSATFGLENRITANISRLANGIYTSSHFKTRIKLGVTCGWNTKWLFKESYILPRIIMWCCLTVWECLWNYWIQFVVIIVWCVYVLPSWSAFLIISSTSLLVGDWPNDLITSINSSAVILPLPSLSKSKNAFRKSRVKAIILWVTIKSFKYRLIRWLSREKEDEIILYTKQHLCQSKQPVRERKAIRAEWKWMWMFNEGPQATRGLNWTKLLDEMLIHRRLLFQVLSTMQFTTQRYPLIFLGRERHWQG